MSVWSMRPNVSSARRAAASRNAWPAPPAIAISGKWRGKRSLMERRPKNDAMARVDLHLPATNLVVFVDDTGHERPVERHPVHCSAAGAVLAPGASPQSAMAGSCGCRRVCASKKRSVIAAAFGPRRHRSRLPGADQGCVGKDRRALRCARPSEGPLLEKGTCPRGLLGVERTRPDGRVCQCA